MSAPRKPAAEHRLDAVRAEEEAWRQILAAYPPRIRTEKGGSLPPHRRPIPGRGVLRCMDAEPSPTDGGWSL